MIPIQVTLVPLTEKPEKIMGPEWRKEGPRHELARSSRIVIRAEADSDDSGDASR